ncbi:hypothetical protein DEO23_13770 [Brachybacterium endophyticum]|uniref:Secreted protein n=1 Tax=Brachybacterium endophyticum TaxID=2182385 RepID=A0A2U2RH09_9MICO|nr:DUF5719 family protein [Brachybacterium endophyticum]PWH05147.1 hypothetical protein DEO23_13770 [Brachybacterium endophyticum]
MSARDTHAPHGERTERGARPLLGLLSVLPLLAVGGIALFAPGDALAPRGDVKHESSTAAPSTTGLVCPGPLTVPDALADTGGDAELASKGPSDVVGVRGLALDADSSLLYGRVAASTTRQDENGDPLAPTIETKSSDRKAAGQKARAADLGAAALTIPQATKPAELTLSGSSQEVVGDAVQASTTTTGDFRSMALTRCAAPTTEATFLGSSTRSGASSSLWLSNTSDRPATASVQVRTADGPADMGGRSQVVVAPGKQERVLLESIVPDQDVIGVSVSTVGAPLAMALQGTERDGLTPQGAEMLSGLPEPSRDATVPGVRVGKGGSGQVVMMNEGGRDAQVRLSASDTDGPVDLPGLGDEITVPAGSVATVPLDGAQGDLTITSRSDQPVSTAVRSSVKSDKRLGKTIGAPSDLAVTQPAPALTDAGVLALPAGGAHGTLALASDADTSATVIPVGEDGGGGRPVQMDLAEGATAQVAGGDLTGVEGEVAGLVVVPDDPDAVHATWIQAESGKKDGPLLSSIPVLPRSSDRAAASVQLG